jgi:acetoin utilization deacetylase AcuC-like enzyme
LTWMVKAYTPKTRANLCRNDMSTNTITIIAHPEFLDHDTGGGDHPEVSGRVQAINDKLQVSHLAHQLNYVQPEPAEREWLLSYHTESWLLRFEEEVLSGRSYIGHPDNQVCYETFRVALLSAGAGLTGVDLAEEGTHGSIFCANRPPGHHAEAGVPFGFCFLNNCVIAARYWQKKYGRNRICVLDFDAHHGNGIQSAFEDEADTLYISIHEHPSFSYPGTGLEDDNGNGEGAGTICNIPLLPGAKDEQMLKMFDERVEKEIAQFKPEALIIAAGFDAHQLDDMSGLHFSTGLFEQLGKRIGLLAQEYCHGRLLSILEGGYHIPSLSESVESYLVGLQSVRK